MGLSCSCTVPIKNPWILQPRFRPFPAYFLVCLFRPVCYAPLCLLQSALHAYTPCRSYGKSLTDSLPKRSRLCPRR